MTDLAREDLSLDELATPKAGRARTALIKRLTDVVCLPSSRVNAHERTIRELKLSQGGLQVGEALDDFEGVLTGLPAYHGRVAMLSGASEGGKA